MILKKKSRKNPRLVLEKNIKKNYDRLLKKSTIDPKKNLKKLEKFLKLIFDKIFFKKSKISPWKKLNINFSKHIL